MKSASNRGILNGSHHVLHIHVLLAATLVTGHMGQLGTDQHQSRIVVQKDTHHPETAADFSPASKNHIFTLGLGLCTIHMIMAPELML